MLESKAAAGEAEELTFADFTELYMDELRQGKFWGVHHDLEQALGCPVDGAGEGPSFQAIFDYVYCGPGLVVEAVSSNSRGCSCAQCLHACVRAFMPVHWNHCCARQWFQINPECDRLTTGRRCRCAKS